MEQEAIEGGGLGKWKGKRTSSGKVISETGGRTFSSHRRQERSRAWGERRGHGVAWRIYVALGVLPNRNGDEMSQSARHIPASPPASLSPQPSPGPDPPPAHLLHPARARVRRWPRRDTDARTDDDLDDLFSSRAVAIDARPTLSHVTAQSCAARWPGTEHSPLSIARFSFGVLAAPPAWTLQQPFSVLAARKSITHHRRLRDPLRPTVRRSDFAFREIRRPTALSGHCTSPGPVPVPQTHELSPSGQRRIGELTALSLSVMGGDSPWAAVAAHCCPNPTLNNVSGALGHFTP